ncbi:lipid A deacylase LpxR family protein [Telmatospirillum sp. J64-1]|uniref:lipid A deacylase LpxR family protein n=1 Tax=Telmatospirillum sp. J64-1 TaxID=2502183 RepID=UPI00115E76A5|nr:lipid A deacylase LpxR family protein [Telmatospirillum sp. J64-1]
MAHAPCKGLLALVSCLIPVCFAFSSASAAEPEKGTFSFILENDFFYENDRGYTNGLQFRWTSSPQTEGWPVRMAQWLPFFSSTGEIRKSYALGQNMYTPSDLESDVPSAEDRPYAGWLYGAVALIADGEHYLDQLQLQVGVVGPASFAEQAQKLIHRWTDSGEPQGWRSQLRNEPGVVLTYQRSWKAYRSDTILGGLGFDVTPHFGAALGNVFTYANTGATLRVGWNLSNDYGAPRIQPSMPGSGFFKRREGIGLYYFAGVEGRAVARNIFLDGNTWQDSARTDKVPLVGDLQMGMVLTLGTARLTYTHVLRTKEFKHQQEDDRFGSVSLSVRF